MAADFQKIARLDFREALTAANREKLPWSKCQALAWVSRYGPKPHVIATAQSAIAAASEAEDSYQAVFPIAWPLRALLERNEVEAASEALKIALGRSGKISPLASRSEALFLIFQAVMCGPDRMWGRAFESLASASTPANHWRQRRNMRDAVLMIAAANFERAGETIKRLDDDKLKGVLLSKLESGEFMKPRIFFW